MMFVKRLFDKQYSFLRTVRPIYLIHNLFNYASLKENKPLYKQLGLPKPVWWSISGKDFVGKKADSPWLDRVNAKQALILDGRFQLFPAVIQQEMLQWPDQGYMVLQRFFDPGEVDTINNEIERLIAKGDLYLNYSGKQIISAYKKSTLINQLLKRKELVQILEFILDKEVNLFQTINFLKGSEIQPHSDFFHMATFPAGNSLAVWIALEDVDENNGPLLYYPGSHKLPYIHSHDFAHESSFFHLDPQLYMKYESRIKDLIEKSGLKSQQFYAKKGDVFIWHGNLLHGGAAIRDKERTRKSMVIHYFAKNVICYHEITQRPAIQNNK